MAFAGLGDAILYPVLPVYADKLEIPVIWVGLMLSINRFVRIAANIWIANKVSLFGMKKVLIFSSIIAVFTTAVYGLRLGVISFFIARILWGLCYSGLKISTLNYGAMAKKKSGLIFGLSQGVKSIGAVMALWLGPVLIDNIGLEKGLLTLAAISMMAIWLSWLSPNITPEHTDLIKTKLTFSPTPINLLIGILAISIDGILVVVLADLLMPTVDGSVQLLTLVAFYLLVKRMSMVGISIVAGLVSVRISPLRLFEGAIVLCILGLILLASGNIIFGIVIVFVFNAVVITFAPLISILMEKSNNSLQAISSTSTWWDLGAGIGSLVGLLLIRSLNYQYLFLCLSILVIVLFINFILSYAITDRKSI